MSATRERRANFTISREELELFLTRYPNVPLSVVAKQSFLEFLKSDEKLQNTTQKKIQNNSLDERIKKLKAADLVLKLWDRMKHSGWTLDQLEFLVNNGEIPEQENKPLNIEQQTMPELLKFGKTITNNPKQILQDNGTLRCNRCNRIFPMKGFNFQQLDDYRNHAEEVHGGLEESERIELLKIYPN